MSNAHGWSTGPASALTAHTVGIRALTPGGLQYVVAPHFGDLSHCQGRLSFRPFQYVDVAWSVDGTRVSLVVDSASHASSVGRVELPYHRPQIDSLKMNGANLLSSSFF